MEECMTGDVEIAGTVFWGVFIEKHIYMNKYFWQSTKRDSMSTNVNLALKPGQL